MAQKTSHYGSAPKRFAPTNRIILGGRSAFWIFWSMAAIMAVLIVGATYWLLTHPMI